MIHRFLRVKVLTLKLLRKQRCVGVCVGWGRINVQINVLFSLAVHSYICFAHDQCHDQDLMIMTLPISRCTLPVIHNNFTWHLPPFYRHCINSLNPVAFKAGTSHEPELLPSVCDRLLVAASYVQIVTRGRTPPCGPEHNSVTLRLTQHWPRGLTFLQPLCDQIYSSLSQLIVDKNG